MPTAAQLRRLVETFDWDVWNAKIRSAVDEGYRTVATEQGDRAVDEFDLDEEFDADDPFVARWFTRYVGERITQLDETTRDVVREELQSALEDGKADSVQDLAGRLRETVSDSAAFSPARALTIARTETATAYNHGALLAYDQNGIDRVEVSDGDGDDECAEADGAIWSVDEAMGNPVEHPNCTRAFAPVIDDADQDDEE